MSKAIKRKKSKKEGVHLILWREAQKKKKGLDKNRKGGDPLRGGARQGEMVKSMKTTGLRHYLKETSRET